MKKLFKFSIIKTLLSILPIALIVIVICLTLVPVSTYDIVLFAISTILLIIGMELFTRGADRAMLPMGENIGSNLSKSRKLVYFILCSLLFGFIITLAEPDVLVLAEQIVTVNKWVFIGAVSLGVSIFLLIAVMRIIFNVKITTVLFISYSIILILMFFVPANFLPVTFDAGAVTSGPVSIPFILALGTGISAVRSSKNSKDDSFGLIALTSIGPILITMILGLFIDPNFTFTRTIADETIFQVLFKKLYEILIILAPMTIIFFAFNFKSLRLPKSRIIKISIGLGYTYIGLALFLTGVSVGYLKIAGIIGYGIAENFYWLLIPLSILFGLVIVFAEPSVHILNKKVEEVTNGIIRKKIMMITMAVGVSLALLLVILRIIYEINIIYIILPCYIAMLALLFLTPRRFSAIAFDSGGVAAGAMASCFILPFAIGVCEALGNNIMSSAFGTIAIIATIPVLAVQTLGLVYKILRDRKKSQERRGKKSNVEIIEFSVGGSK